MRPVNLIPPDQRRGDSAPLRTGPLVYVLTGGLALLLLGIVGVALTSKQVSDREAKKANLQQELTAATARAQSVKAFTDFASVEQNRSQTITSLATSRFDWERVLREMSLVMPDGVNLSTIKGTVSPAVQLQSTAGGSSSNGTNLRQQIEGPALEVTGCAPSHDLVATFVARLGEIDGVTRVGLDSSSLPDQSTQQTGEPGDASANPDTCPIPFFPKFSIVVAFDKVPAPGTAAPPAPSPSGSGQPADAETQGQQNAVQASVKSANDKAHNAIHAIGVGG